MKKKQNKTNKKTHSLIYCPITTPALSHLILHLALSSPFLSEIKPLFWPRTLVDLTVGASYFAIEIVPILPTVPLL